SKSTETTDGLSDIQAQLNNLGREIKKVNEKVYVAQVGCERCKGPHYTKDCPLKEEEKTLKEAYYTQFGGPFQGGGYRAAALGFYQRNNVNPSYQERRQSMEDTLSKFMSESTKRHEENSNLIKEIRASTDAAIRNQGASIKTLEIQIRKMSKVLQERGFGSLPSSTEENQRDQVKSISTTVEADSYPIPYSEASHIDNSIPKKEKDPGSFTLPCFINNVCFDNALITLRVGEERIIFKSVKPASSLIKRVYMLSLRERMELDLEARLMGETLVLNRSLDPLDGDYIELNDLNEPLELRRDQGDDLMPTIEEGEVIEEFRTRDEDLDTGINDYPSYCDHDKKIHIDCAHNLKFSCMIGFEFTHVNFFPLLYVNVMSKKFHNSIMKDKMVYKGNNVVGALMNVPIFVGTFSVVTDFVVLEDMDAYRNEGMGDVIIGKPFLKKIGIKARRFEGIITIYNVIMEYLVNISKRRAFWSLNEDILKITVLTTNTPYPSRKIRRIVILTTSVSRPQLKSNQLEDRVMHNNSQGKKQQVDDHHRNFKTKQPIVVPISTRKPKRNVNQSVATSLKKIVVAESTNKKPRNKIRKQYGHVSKTCRWCYGDLVQGNITIKRVYYVEGLNHNLFSVGQFCEADLEVAFRKSTCYIHDLKGNDLLTDSRGTNLYSITLQNTSTPNPICLMGKLHRHKHGYGIVVVYI
ncbi:hypothetical protein Tco_0855269, partial [Tanacetum coccineum]